ncbi:hypothetical protein PG985_009740 [Apiospora marii]|uniref:uncharacterized protein n=1 Tax=Apiospora marii TaxID=335849 RepID=UPI00313061C9
MSLLLGAASGALAFMAWGYGVRASADANNIDDDAGTDTQFADVAHDVPYRTTHLSDIDLHRIPRTQGLLPAPSAGLPLPPLPHPHHTPHSAQVTQTSVPVSTLQPMHDREQQLEITKRELEAELLAAKTPLEQSATQGRLKATVNDLNRLRPRRLKKEQAYAVYLQRQADAGRRKWDMAQNDSRNLRGLSTKPVGGRVEATRATPKLAVGQTPCLSDIVAKGNRAASIDFDDEFGDDDDHGTHRRSPVMRGDPYMPPSSPRATPPPSVASDDFLDLTHTTPARRRLPPTRVEDPYLISSSRSSSPSLSPSPSSSSTMPATSQPMRKGRRKRAANSPDPDEEYEGSAVMTGFRPADETVSSNSRLQHQQKAKRARRQ